METLTDFALREEYRKVKKLGDKFAEVDSVIYWEAFRPIIGSMYNNKTEKGGHPNIDELMMFKIGFSSNGTVCPIQIWKGRSLTGFRSGDSSVFLKAFQIFQQFGRFGNVWPRPKRTACCGRNFNGNWIITA